MEEELQQEELVDPSLIGPTGNVEQVKSEIVEHKYAAPFQSKIGKSSIDLTKQPAQDKMLDEYNTWWNHGLNMGLVAEDKKDERGKLRDNWYQKYHGMSFEDYTAAEDQQPKKTIYGYEANLKGFGEQFDHIFQGLSTPGLGLVDFGMDAIGLLGKQGDALDDKWDMATKLDSPIHQKMREVFSIVIPSIISGGKTNAALGKMGLQNMPALMRNLIKGGAWWAESQVITHISDTSEDHNLGGVMVQMFPNTFGPGGSLPLPEAYATLDSDSPSIRKEKNKLEAGALSWMGHLVGSVIDLKRAQVTNQVKPKQMEWFIPKDDNAIKYKQESLFKGADEDLLIRIQEINEVLSTKKLSKQNENILINELISLEDEVGMIANMDDAIRRGDLRAADEADQALTRKINNPDQLELDLGIDPDLVPDLFDVSATARQVPPPGNVARNMGDTTAIKLGNSTGDPAPVITEAMLNKGLMVGPTSRGAVMGVAEAGRMAGRFDAVVDGFRYSNEQMNAAAYGIYKDIISAESLDDVQALFLQDRDVKNLLLGRFKVETLNEEQARGAAFAIKYLTDRFLGYDVTAASARVMDTLGREITSLAESVVEIAPFSDESRVMDLIIDKLLFLMDEYGLNKYISGWQLRNKNWFNEVPPGEFDDVIGRLTQEFTDAENAVHAKNLRFTKTLKALKKQNPEAMKPLVAAFRASDGDVDTLAKLYKWTEDQVTPWGAIRSPNPKEMNFFAKGLWNYHMNNTLSGKAPLNAAIGNLYQITIKPLTSMLGHVPYSLFDRNIDGLRRTIYFHSAIFETNRRSLNYAFKMMKKVHKDPEALVRAARKDFVVKRNQTQGILKDMYKVYEADGNYGMLKQLDLAFGLNDIGQIPALRWGMTGLVAPDAYANSMLATYVTRMKAYDEVLYEFGAVSDDLALSKLKEAEARLAKEMFDVNGMAKDPVLKAIAGEVQLNLDDGVSRWLNQAVTAYPISRYLLMFPRTQNNWVKNAASWTPFSAIPGMNRYAKTIYAKTDDDIAAALLEHGIDMKNTPNARVIFEQLRADYTGRLMFSGMLFSSLWTYAMSGNIRGNGSYNASTRMKERDQFGYVPKTIKIGDTWRSYEGIPGVEQVLSILGDMAYYASDLNEPMIENLGSKLMWSLTAAFNNETPLASLEPLIAVLNGDLSGFNRLTAQIARTFIPASSALGILSEAIDGSQKDIEGEMYQYLMNKTPGLRNMLPDRVNPFGGPNMGRTGPNPNNPWEKLRAAIDPTYVSTAAGGDDMKHTTSTGKVVTFNETMDWLRGKANYGGIGKLNMDSTGSYKYSAAERELILTRMAERQPWRQIAEIMVNPEYAKQIEDFQYYIKQNPRIGNEKILLKLRLLPFYKAINKVMKNEQRIAEQLSRIGDKYIIDQQYTDKAMKEGNVKEAERIQTENLLKYNNN